MAFRRVWAALSVALLLAAAPSAQAADDPETLIRQGVTLRRQGQEAVAYGYIRRAYDIAPTPRTAAQLGLVELALGRNLDAEQHLSEALAKPDPWIDQNAEALQKSWGMASKLLGRVKVVGSPRGARVRSEDRPPMFVPADGQVWVTPGRVSLTIEAPGQSPQKKEISVAAGAIATVAFESQAVAPQGPATREVRLAGFVVAGAGVATVVTGVLLYRAGASKLDAIENDAAAKRDYNPANGNFATFGNAGVACMISGGVAAAAGAALYFYGRRSGSAEAAAQIALAPRFSVGIVPGVSGRMQIEGSF